MTTEERLAKIREVAAKCREEATYFDDDWIRDYMDEIITLATQEKK